MEIEGQAPVVVAVESLPPQSQTPAPLIDNDSGEVVEEITDAAVTIAEIEAGKEIAIAEINADLQRDLDDNYTERREAEIQGENQWQEIMTNMQALAQQVTGLAETVASLQGQASIPPALEELGPETETEIAPEILSIPQSIADATSSTPMEPLGESVAESLAAGEIEPAPRKRRRAI